MIRSPLLDALPGLAHGLTDRVFGSISPASDPVALARRVEAVARLGGARRSLVTPHQVHGDRVAVVTADDAATTLPATDGLATSEHGLPLMVQGADCPLVLLVAVSSEGAASGGADALAVVHSGWRGTVAGITRHAVLRMDALGACPARLRAAVFPGIGPCCFEVGPEVVERFEAAFGAGARAWVRPAPRAGHSLLDLPAALVATLTAAGLGRESVDVVPGCTACGGILWTHRGSGGRPERHGLFALLR